MDLTKGDMLIMSGEGTGAGTIERYYGARTERAIRSRLSRERCHGDRWAEVWIELEGTIDKGWAEAGMDHKVYGQLGRDLDEIGDMRTIAPTAIRDNPAAQLRAGKPNPASAVNGAKGGRPRKQS